MKLAYLGMGENISAKHCCNEKHIRYLIITMEGGGNGGNWHLRLQGWQNRTSPPPSTLGTVDERLLVARTCDIPAPMYVQLPVSGVQCL